MFYIIDFIKKLQTFIFSPAVRVYVGFLSEKKRLKSFGKKPRICWEQELQGRNILLLALYERGFLRPDILRLIKAAKAQGMYILGVNTLKLAEPEQYKDIIDCYIEKFNYGRDFSSYKTGFIHIYKHGWESECARILMVNDSVFYTTKGLKKFLRDMIETEVEALGSTENFERSYHLGSFCISMSTRLVHMEEFKNYWQRYKSTDVRPLVISRGEMRLTKILNKCVSTDLNLRALYGVTKFLKSVELNPSLVDFALQNQRSSTHITTWHKASIRSVVTSFFTNFLFGRDISKCELMLSSVDNKVLDQYYVNSVDNIVVFLNSVTSKEINLDKNLITKLITAELAEAFVSGSQIHQNAPILLNIGLPFVKLDGLYRGVFNQEDIFNITRQLSKSDADELRELLLSRPYGGTTLVGWRLSAFMRGLI